MKCTVKLGAEDGIVGVEKKMILSLKKKKRFKCGNQGVVEVNVALQSG